MIMRTLSLPLTLGLFSITTLVGCGEDTATTGDTPGHVSHALFVAHEGTLVSYDIETGKERSGTVQDVAGPAGLQALADGTLLVNLTDRNEILVVDPETTLEKSRIPASTKGGTRPVHSYLSPERNGKSYWLTLDDGEDGSAQGDKALFLDTAAKSPTYLQPVLEFGLGIGHHEAAFSATQERVVISNQSDCHNVMSVYDYTDLANPKFLIKFTADEAGWDDSSLAKTCDPDPQKGTLPAPHGCATSRLNGYAYCNLSGSGDLVLVDIDAGSPGFGVTPTTGSGAGHTLAGPGGNYVYSLQATPREADAGADCQIGQLLIIDAAANSIAAPLPLFYDGPDCTKKLAGTDEETASPDHLRLSADGKTMFITLASAPGLATGRVRAELVLDLTNPAVPVQKASIPVGASTGPHGDALSGDGKWLFITNNADASVTQIDVATLTVTRTITTADNPLTIATYGTDEGPGQQTGPLP